MKRAKGYTYYEVVAVVVVVVVVVVIIIANTEAWAVALREGFKVL